MPRAPFTLGGARIPAGQRQVVNLPVSAMPDTTQVNMPVEVVHGRRDGPVMFVSAAIHGDEVIGVEIVRRLLHARPLASLAGTLLAVPIVNGFGFLNHSRYLPDRRDLNRSFRGHAAGSLAARLADLFMSEVVRRADVGIDLHSAAVGRENLPQIRLTPGNPALGKLAADFGAPVLLTSKLRDGSLRMAAEAEGVRVLLFEAGEGLRFDEYAARSGVAGILRVMHALDMIGPKGVPRRRIASLVCDRSLWHRAPMGGLLRTMRASGDAVRSGDVLGLISDPFGTAETELQASESGIVIGRSNLPIVNEGDALFHIALASEACHAEAAQDHQSRVMDAEPLFDEDEII